MSDQIRAHIKRVIGIIKDWIMVRLLCLTGEKNSFSALWRLIYTTTGYISSVFAFAVLMKDLTGFEKALELCKNKWWMLILMGAIASLIHNHSKISCQGIKTEYGFQIAVKIADIFCINASSYVIPTNTFFRTVMEGEYISSQSVQGAFQLKHFRNRGAELDKLIADSLKQQKLEYEDCTDNYGTVKKYPIGTVSKVDYARKHYYFVAINDVNEYGKPINQEYKNIDKAINNLINTITTLGHCDDLAIPLIGTGRAAIKDATIEKVVEDIINTFLRSPNKICRKLIICIRSKDYLEGKADMIKIQKFIDYVCEFY